MSTTPKNTQNIEADQTKKLGARKARTVAKSGTASSHEEHIETNVGQRILLNLAKQTVTEISVVDKPSKVTSLPKTRYSSTKRTQAEDTYNSVLLPAEQSGRLTNGFKIVQNRAYQQKQKIKRGRLTTQSTDEIEYKKLFTRFEEAFSTHDIGEIGRCLSPAFQWRQPNGDVIYGRQEALSEMERRFATPNGPRFSDVVWRFKGTTVIQNYTVEYMGPDRKWRRGQGMDLYEIADGLIFVKDAFWKIDP